MPFRPCGAKPLSEQAMIYEDKLSVYGTGIQVFWLKIHSNMCQHGVSHFVLASMCQHKNVFAVIRCILMILIYLYQIVLSGYFHLRKPQGLSKWFSRSLLFEAVLTHWYRVPHTCVTVWGHYRNKRCLMGTNFSEYWTYTVIFPLKIHSKLTPRIGNHFVSISMC